MPNLAKIQILGYLGHGPEIKSTPGGKQLCQFSVAVSGKYIDKEGAQQTRTTWFRVTCWQKLAEIAAQYLQKGSAVFVDGRLDVREYTGRDGTNKTSLEITANDLQLPGSKDGGKNDNDLIAEDDIPF